jgi:hypothetical protein
MTRERVNAQRYKPKEWETKREEIKKRCHELSERVVRKRDNRKSLANCVKRYPLRKRAEIDYDSADKVQPNLRHRKRPPERDPVTIEMERSRKKGYKLCEVRESMIEGAGKGLYMKKDVKKGGRQSVAMKGWK